MAGRKKQLDGTKKFLGANSLMEKRDRKKENAPVSRRKVPLG